MSTVAEQTILQKIQQRGYWRVIIRPSTFQEDRIADCADLYSIVKRRSVQLRGWSYPQTNGHEAPRTGTDWVGQECDGGDSMELWRLYLSGQFFHNFTLQGDWKELSKFSPIPTGWRWGQELDYIDTIYTLVEIYEFAERLAFSPAGAPVMVVEIEVNNLAGRYLVAGPRFGFKKGEYTTQTPVWKRRWQGTQPELIASNRELAANSAKDLLKLFGLDVSLRVITEIQKGMKR